MTTRTKRSTKSNRIEAQATRERQPPAEYLAQLVHLEGHCQVDERRA